MTLDDLRFLLSPTGQALLAELPPITPHNHLQLASRLRREVAPEHAQALLETALLRQEAVAKFSRAAQMVFTREALEQASAETVAAHRAQRFADAGCRLVVDLGCGIGGDALALAQHVRVIGVERDGLRLAMARENLRVYGRADQFQPLQADLLELPPMAVDGIFFDPARRDENGRRLYSVHDYHPPLSLIDQWRTRTPRAAVKISPGVDYAELPLDAEIEFISLDGAVREGVLWYGDLRSSATRRATLLPGGHTLTAPDEPAAPVATTTPQAYLYEPDGAVIRAHLVQPLARLLNAAQIDPDIAYLTAADMQVTPFARCFAIEDYFPFQLKRLRAYLRRRGIGRVTVKKRGSPLEPAWLQQQLRLRGSEHRILFLTQIQGEAAVLIGRELKQ